MNFNTILSHLSEINTGLKQIDPDEENPSMNSIIASVILAEEATKALQDKLINQNREFDNIVNGN